MMHSTVYSTQLFTLLKYMPSVAARLHMIVAVHFPRRPNYDMKASYSLAEKLRNATDLLKSLRIGAMKSSRVFHSARELTTSTLPALFYAAQPPVQSVHSQLLSAKDMNLVGRCVELMSTYGLGYSMKYEAEAGGAVYGFEP
jgi:hypothetical protein